MYVPNVLFWTGHTSLEIILDFFLQGKVNVTINTLFHETQNWKKLVVLFKYEFFVPMNNL